MDRTEAEQQLKNLEQLIPLIVSSPEEREKFKDLSKPESYVALLKKLRDNMNNIISILEQNLERMKCRRISG